MSRVPFLNFKGVPGPGSQGPEVPGPGVLVSLLHHAIFKSWIFVYMKRYFIFIHLQFYCCSFFFTRGNFDWRFFIKLIWWIEHVLIFKIWSNWFHQIKMCQILLFTLSNLYDSINLIKLTWRSVIKRPTDSTTNGQTSATSGQTGTTSE